MKQELLFVFMRVHTWLNMSSLLKHRNPCDTGGAGRQTCGGVLRGDAAEGQHRNPHRGGRLAQGLEAQRRAVRGFRSGIKDRPEDGEIGALVFGSAQAGERVRGDADADAGRHDREQ